jgi:flavin reductase (DIM6/NTAB) family NADH-FMN oxidoreductase RutF/DNA-binding IclR family transcriptional regulator
MSHPIVSAQEFRRALAHYPTGVAVVTAVQADGSPVSMVVGTFTSVSLDPPLVGFLADRNSASWQGIKAAGHYCVSVLGAAHEHVCRAFATKDPERFRYATTLTDAGCPRLDEAALWVDCTIDDVLTTGDHDLALGRVRQLGLGDNGGAPLLFLRGGYGAPQIASLQAEAPGLGPVLRLADAVRPEIEKLSEEIGLESVVLAAVDCQVVMLAAAGIDSVVGSSMTYVGSTFPLAAPLAPVFLAWSGPEEQHRWLAEGTRLAGTDVTAIATAALDSVRRRGHEVTTGKDVSERFRRVVLGAGAEADVPKPEFDEIVRAVVGQRDPALDRPLEELTDVTALMVPVRDGAGRVVLSLGILGFTGDEDRARLRQCLDRLEVAAERATELLAGLPAA